MVEIELKAPDRDVTEAVERCAERCGLVSRRGSLAKYSGSTHWHFRKTGSTGTLECTWWPSQNRLWLGLHSNRTAGWQDAAISSFLAEDAFPC